MGRARYLLLLVLLAFSGWLVAETIRWGEGRPGCTFTAGDDGKYRYGLWAGELGIVIAVDADEVRKANLRVEPLFAVFFVVRYRGDGSLKFNPSQISLEFVTHYKTRQDAIDPVAFAAKLQSDTDAFAENMRKQIQRHPEKAGAQESMLVMHEEDVKRTKEFLTSQNLRAAELNRAAAEINGWVFFSTKSKWLGGWKKHEEFVLRVSAGENVFEYPFALPPSSGDLLLRRRAQE